MLTVSRDYDLPRSIVWDAFVDPDLIDGWLPPGVLTGEVTTHEPRQRLVVSADSGDILEFRLIELEGGTRGTATEVTVIVEGNDSDSDATARWAGYLANLERLLRGHPVDWSPRRIDGETAVDDAGA